MHICVIICQVLDILLYFIVDTCHNGGCFEVDKIGAIACIVQALLMCCPIDVHVLFILDPVGLHVCAICLSFVFHVCALMGHYYHYHDCLWYALI